MSTNTVVSVPITSQINQKSQYPMAFFTSLPPFRRDYFICTSCGGYSTGGVYSSLCTLCDGVTSDPPRNPRHQYLCNKCVQYRHVCTCDQPQPVTPLPSPPKYCWCRCCTCCTYSWSCSCCRCLCKCLSSPCERYEPCCYCARLCCPKQRCCKSHLCFWSWCPCFCSPP